MTKFTPFFADKLRRVKIHEDTPARSTVPAGEETLCVAVLEGSAAATRVSSALAGAGITAELLDVTGDDYHDFRLDRPPIRVPDEDRCYEVLVSETDVVKAKQVLRQSQVRPLPTDVEIPQRRFVRAVANVGRFFAPALPIAVIYQFVSTTPATRQYYVLLTAFSAAVLVFCWIVGRRPAKEQRKRQKRTNRIADALQAGSCDEGFCLFLRSFSHDGATTHSYSLRSPSFVALSGTRTVVVDLEDVFAVAWDDLDLPQVAIGAPDERFGSGRIPSDDATWKELAGRAMDEAAVIMMIPGASAGTLWEAEYIGSNGLLAKCLFLMPPSSDDADWGEHWSVAQRVGFKWFIPGYVPEGMLFRVGSGGSVEWSEPLPHRPSIESIRRLVRRALA